MGTSCFIVDPLSLAAGGMGEQSGLLVVGIDGACGYDIIFILVHQGKLGIVTSYIRESQEKKTRERAKNEKERENLLELSKMGPNY